MKLISKIGQLQLLAILAVVFINISCSDDMFDQQAGERITPDQYYNSFKDVQNIMDGIYIPMQNAMPNLILVDGLRSDQMDVTANANSDLRAINELSLSADNPYLDPSDLYKVIINVNEILANIDTVVTRDPSFRESDNLAYKGVLVGIRSSTYLTLARLYGEVAWIDDNMTAVSGDRIYLKKEALIDTLINQLLPYIPEEDPNTIEEPVFGFVNKYAVLGELYLESQDYANAVTYLKRAIETYWAFNNAIYMVTSQYEEESWKSIFINSEGGWLENMAVVPYNSNEGQPNGLLEYLLPEKSFMVKPSICLVDSFRLDVPTTGSELGDIYRGLGVTYDTLSTANDTYISKYSLDGGQPYSTDIVLARASELHFLLAEAENRNGNSAVAIMLINDGYTNAPRPKPEGYNKFTSNIGIRGRVALENKAVVDTTGMENGDEIIMLQVEDLIIAEKALECAFEGKRMFDLVRVAERRTDEPSYLANKVSAKFMATEPAKAEEIKNKLMIKDNWYLPFER